MPWYNRTGWLGVKHQLTYHPTFNETTRIQQHTAQPKNACIGTRDLFATNTQVSETTALQIRDLFSDPLSRKFLQKGLVLSGFIFNTSNTPFIQTPSVFETHLLLSSTPVSWQRPHLYFGSGSATNKSSAFQDHLYFDGTLSRRAYIYIKFKQF